MYGSSASWAYLAGFTDGDGCITRESSKRRYAYARIRWSQKESDSAVLDWIGDFLGSQGVKVSQRNYCVVRGESHRYPQRELGITNAEDTRLVLHELMPYLVVKRDRAVEALALLDYVHGMKQRFGNKYRIAMGGCTVEGCNEPYDSKEFCKRHYDAWRRGDLSPAEFRVRCAQGR